MKMLYVHCVKVMLIAMLLAISAPLAQAYPDKPVKLIVPFNPGGGTDQQARMVEKDFKEEFGQAATFIYKPGADGAIGGTEIANSKPDGLTIGVYTFPLFYMNILTEKGRYKLDSFDYLAISSLDIPVLVSRKDSPIKDFATFIAEAKANPDKKLTVGTTETLGPTHIAALKLQQLGIPINIVIMAGGSKAMAAVLGGHIDVLFTPMGAAQNSAKSLNFLAIASEKREKQLADVPTMGEEGFPVVAMGARIWVAPKGLPADVKQRLVDGFRKIYSKPDVIERHTKAGQNISFGTDKELEKIVNDFSKEGPALVKLYLDSKQ